MVETNSDEIELRDLGDACKETRQVAPGTSYPDSIYFLGRWPGWMEDVG